MCADLKSAKNTIKPSVFFAFSGSGLVKAASKMLVKSTPEIAETQCSFANSECEKKIFLGVGNNKLTIRAVGLLMFRRQSYKIFSKALNSLKIVNSGSTTTLMIGTIHIYNILILTDILRHQGN